jgi:hypothetical protein
MRTRQNTPPDGPETLLAGFVSPRRGKSHWGLWKSRALNRPSGNLGHSSSPQRALPTRSFHAQGVLHSLVAIYGGKDSAEVVLVAIEGMGHTWPGRQSLVKFLGKSTKNVSANEMMWEFFKKHGMK